MMKKCLWMAWMVAVVSLAGGARAQEVDSDGDGLSDAWERGVGRYEVVAWTNGWIAAKADAEARGGHLATITSEAEWVAVSNMFGSAKLMHCWLGGTDEEEEGVWKWVTGEKWRYERWNSGEPNNWSGEESSVEHYLETVGAGWNDATYNRVVITNYLLEFAYFTNLQNADTDGDGVNDGEEYELGWDPTLNDRDGTGNQVVSVVASQRTPGEGLVDIEYKIEGHAADEEWLEVELAADVFVNGKVLRIGALSGEVTAAAGTHRMTWDSGVDWPGLDAGNVVIRLSLVPKAEPGTWYVSPTGDDEADGRSWATAKKTLQTAVELAVDGERVLVAPGTYGPIVMSNKSIRVQGVGGAEETILDGGGSERVADNGGPKPVLIGLTLQHGFAPGNTHGGGARYGTFHNCIIRDNESDDDGGGVWSSICHNCLITGNHANDVGQGGSGGGACRSTLYNCTVVDNRCANSSNSKWGAGIASCRVYNCIVWDNYRDDGTLNNCVLSTNLSTCTTPAVSGTGNITSNPDFVDAAHGNYRLATNSPCLNKGTNAYVSVTTDLAGNQRIVGGVDMGAYECGAAYGCSTVKVPSEFAVSEGRSGVFGVYTQDSDGDGLYDAWERGEGRYEIVNFKGTWEEAKADAEAKGGHLATITSEAEWVVISNMFGTNVLGCWLGATDEEEEGVWKWVTGEPWGYTRWDPGQPDNKAATQHYLLLGENGNWDDGAGDFAENKYLFETGCYTDPLNADTDGDGVADGEEYELGRSPVVNEAEGTVNKLVSVECRQRWPWNGLVDIDYEIGGWGTNEEDLVVVLRGTAMVGGEEIELKTLTGEVTAAAGRHRMTWDSAADWGGEGVAEATVKLEIITPYLIVDMIGGQNAANWPMTRMKEVPAGGWTTDDKTTRMVMRRIEAGRFQMGGEYDVTISKPFYIGVFEVTQRQWELATGSNPSQYRGDARPVEKVSYDMIRGDYRGAFWPANGSYDPAYAVDGTSFVWKARSETGLLLDLPTEAQWEYACRAGTTSDFNNGGDTEDDLRLVGRYYGNQTDGKGGYSQYHTTVGSYLPNAWGLYDMHGNVWEWCLDWYGSPLTGGTDPMGATSGTSRDLRGGGWRGGGSWSNTIWEDCGSWVRGWGYPTGTWSYAGCRLAAPAGTQSAGSSEAFTLDGRAGKGEAFAGTVGVGIDGITWSGEWADGVAGGTAVVKEEGTALWESAGEGEFTWTPLTAGTRVLTHEVEGTVGGRFSATFEVAKGTQTILFPSLGVQWATNVVELGAVAGSGLPVGYEVVSGPGVVEDGILTFTGPGTVTVRASQAGDGNWEAAPSVTSVASVRAVPTVLALGDLEQVYDGETHGVTVETEPEGVAVRVTYDGSGEEPVHAGDYAVVAVTDDGRYTGRAEGTLHVAKAGQGIVFPAVGSPRWTEEVVLGASAGSGLEVGYAVASGPGRLADGVLSFTGPGVVSVVASQAGNGDWEAAEPVVQEIVVRKGAASVSFADLSQVYDGVAKQVSVMTTPSGLGVDVTYGGEAALPVGAGRYAVAATVVDEKWEGSGEAVLVVSKGSQSIEFGEIGAQVATNVVELSAVASTGMEVKFAVLSGPGTVAGNTLSFTGAGMVTVMALQEGDANWAQATVLRTVSVSAVPVEVVLSGLERVYDGEEKAVGVSTVPEGVVVRVTYDGNEGVPVGAGEYAVVAESADGRYAGRAEGVLVVAKGQQSIEFAEIGEQVATNVVELSAVASSGLAVGYGVEGPAVVEGNVLSFTGAGTVTVTASQAGDANWEAAEAVVREFVVSKAVAEVSLGGLSQLYDGGGKAVEVQTVPEGLSVAVTYDGSLNVPVEAGSYAVVAVVEDARWEGRAEGTLVITGGAQSIEFAEIGEQVATNVVVLGAVASSGLEVSYRVEGPAVVEGSVLSFTGSGTVTVTASQAGNLNWEAAEDVVRSFEVVKASAAVELSGLEQVYDGKTHGVGVATVPEGVTVAVTYDGSGEEPVDAGSYAVVAVVVDEVWEGRAEGVLSVAKGAQSIAFGEIGDQVVTNVVELGAVASSGLAVGYSVEGPAVLEGSVLRFSGVGVVSVTASQAGDGNWEAAEAVCVSFEVRKAVAGVALEGLEQVYDGETHRVGVGTVPEGLSVAVTYDGEESEPVGAGSYRVVAVVVDEVWEGSAEGVLSIAKGAQEIVFPEIGPCGVADRVELSAVAGSGLEVVFAVLSGPGYLEGAVLRFADTGSVTVVAMQGGDVNWEAAEPVRQVVEVGKSAAAVELAGLEQVYDGNAHAVAVETVPAGLAVEVAYGGSTNTPVDAGSYEVVATVVDAKWAGCATGVLHVAKGTQEIDFPAIGPQVVTNRVVLGAVASSGLPVGYAVAAGPGWVEDGVLSFSGVGEVAVVASQYGNGNWEAAAEVTNVVEVSGLLSLSVVSAHGVVSPAAGVHEVMIGTAVEAVAEAEPVALGEGWRAVCTGWRLEGNGPEAGSGTVAAFTLTNSATLTWLWETQALVQAVGLAHGDAEGGGWYALGSTAVLRAVPDAGFAFTGWTGAVPGGQAGANPVELRVAGPGTAVATFYTTFYASVDGDDAADGLSWFTAKREIAAALALAAEGDSVVASDGAYGAVSVPDGVSVRSVGGADATRIAGGAGVRCVVAGDGASVEGFTLVGASVEGNGGGALLAGDAVLRRCVLQGNRAGVCGGGAYGGTLENCLVVGNGASAGGGGGACGSVLRHCTVVRNEGGGARDCRSVNCVFWENGGDDVAGGETSWSRCSPAAPGSGNIEDDPVFAGGGDWRLAYESPCIDAAAETGVRVDLDGAPRPQPRVYGGELKPDMGCREYVPKARFVWDQGRAVPPYESWTDAARDIQSALDVSGSGDRIVVEAGTYGPIAVSNAVIVMGYRGAGETVIDAQGAERAVFLGGGGTLEGFTVRGGVSEDCGGILADGGSTVRDVVVEGCRATGAEGVGGGVCLYGGSTAENVTARGNAAAYGAGFYATATSAVVRCEMDGNTASAWGGGAYLEADSRMEGSRLSANSAVRGGGVYGADCEVAACGLDGNAASGAGGGAALLRATFRNNRVTGNRAASGGGVHAQGSDGHDCLVTGNEAPKGAGVWMEGDGQFWNFTVADNVGTGAGVALRGTSLFGNGIAWGNAGGNLDTAEGTEVRYSCAAPAPDGEGNFAADPSFVGDGDYHLRAGSPCVDTGEVQDWMPEACDFDGQRRVEPGEEGDGRDIWVDVGTDEAALDAVGAPSAASPWWTWRVVPDANLRLQRAAGLLEGTVWEDVGEPFTATGQTWTVDEPFDGTGARFYRLIWRKE